MPVRPGSHKQKSDVWLSLERESLDFRFVQDSIFNLSEAEQDILERLREGGFEFGILPRPDPAAFLTLQLHLNQATQRVEVAVDPGFPAYCSFATRRNAFGEALKGSLDRLFGVEHFDASRCVASRRYVWYSYVMPPSPARPRPRLLQSLFHFDRKELHFLGLLEEAVKRLNRTLPHPLQFHVHPRESASGGIEMMVGEGERRQPVRVFVKGFYPVTYHLVTENTPVGQRLQGYLDAALGGENLDEASSQRRGRFLSLLYVVRHPRTVLEEFEATGN